MSLDFESESLKRLFKDLQKAIIAMKDLDQKPRVEIRKEWYY